MRFRYRLLAGSIFALAAIIVVPIFCLGMGIFLKEIAFFTTKIPGCAKIGATFSPFALLWGGLFASRFRIPREKSLRYLVVVSFLWGCIHILLTIFSCGLSMGFGYARWGNPFTFAVRYAVEMVAYVSLISFGTVYVFGGITGIITSLCLSVDIEK
jgi:hypothetical protein